MSSQERAKVREHYRQLRRQRKRRMLKMTLGFGLLGCVIIIAMLWLFNLSTPMSGGLFRSRSNTALPFHR
jgi:type VI protein secretion system component VasF